MHEEDRQSLIRVSYKRPKNDIQYQRIHDALRTINTTLIDRIPKPERNRAGFKAIITKTDSILERQKINQAPSRASQLVLIKTEMHF